MDEKITGVTIFNLKDYKVVASYRGQLVRKERALHTCVWYA
jgi:hypothetical protein